MVDWKRVIQLLILLAVIIGIFLIASQDFSGKVFAIIIIAILGAYYMRREQKKKVINPVAEYYERLLLLCKLNRNPKLRYLVMSGDHSSQKFTKGLITGGQINRKGKPYAVKLAQTPALNDDGQQLLDDKGTPLFDETEVKRIVIKDGEEKEDERANAYIISYTPNYGLFYNLPVLGWIMTKFFRREYLFCIFESQLTSQYWMGDLEVKGINTRIVGHMEFVNDWMLDDDIELGILNKEVERITLQDNLTMLPYRIRAAVDSNSFHLKNVDTLDGRIG